MKTISILLLCACAVSGFSQESDAVCAVRANTAFAVDVYHEIRQKSENIFFSPYSISTAFAMTFAGARGKTEKQMALALHFTLAQDRLHPAFNEIQSTIQSLQDNFDFRLSIANALWIQDGYKLLPEFLEVNRRHYESNLYNLDFKEDPEKSRLKINDWVEEKTEGKIKDILAEGVIKPLTRLVLTSTIYFKAEWEQQFSPGITKESDFWVTPEEKKNVRMMNQKAYHGYWKNETLQVLEMSYKGRGLSMVVLLPRKIDGLEDLESLISQETLMEWTSSLKRQEVKVFLPKFKTTGDLNLKAILLSMGMIEAFSRDADFSGMEPEKELYITDAVHKAFIEVDEAGTEAAAATAVVVGAKTALPVREAPVFRADHPFLFLIRDNETKSILFMGRIVNPVCF